MLCALSVWKYYVWVFFIDFIYCIIYKSLQPLKTSEIEPRLDLKNMFTLELLLNRCLEIISSCFKDIFN